MQGDKSNDELAKVFGWIKVGIEDEDKLKKKKDHEARKTGEKEGLGEPDLFEQKPNQMKIAQVLKFLDIDASEEEIRAVEEMMIDMGETNFSFKAFEKVFIKTNQEKLKEYDQLLQSFRSLKSHASTRNKHDSDNIDTDMILEKEVSQNKEKTAPKVEKEFILLTDLDTLVSDYQGVYETSFKIIQDDLKNQVHVEGDKFYFKDYFDKVYNIQELRPQQPELEED